MDAKATHTESKVANPHLDAKAINQLNNRQSQCQGTNAAHEGTNDAASADAGANAGADAGDDAGADAGADADADAGDDACI